ncbi:hypothetical protein COV93_01760 [Candidatus Woesearchaeota archaeon CG11_big_fil_rev_8_21_14_0_20_43_8]|nr:MAG: hypothetical protein COV93_01760 [Candidatus Woesearchaeota archaeon CG11_big_fil_rev_8_21_14_0_20_43_8]PIO05105.1 MAG: hypothetical protein COT47_06205 [Candidatus Woesearchaeota archaeon CG08_land_8_20_14_0_20_43_7]
MEAPYGWPPYNIGGVEKAIEVIRNSDRGWSSKKEHAKHVDTLLRAIVSFDGQSRHDDFYQRFEFQNYDVFANFENEAYILRFNTYTNDEAKALLLWKGYDRQEGEANYFFIRELAKNIGYSDYDPRCLVFSIEETSKSPDFRFDYLFEKTELLVETVEIYKRYVGEQREKSQKDIDRIKREMGRNPYR